MNSNGTPTGSMLTIDEDKNGTLFSKVSIQAVFDNHQVTMDEQRRQINEARSLKCTHVSRLAFSDVADPMGFNAFTTNSGKVPSSTLLKHAIRQ